MSLARSVLCGTNRPWSGGKAAKMGFSFKSGEDLLSLCASDQDRLGEQDDTAVASPEKDRIAEREPRRVEMAPLTAELQEMMDLSWPDPPPLPCHVLLLIF